MATNSVQDPHARLWLDLPDAREQAAARTDDPVLRRHAEDMIRDGFTVLRGAPTAGLCDHIVEDFERFCERHQLVTKAQRNRLYYLEATSVAACTALLDPVLMRTLDYLMGYKAVLYATQMFEYGSHQRTHRDSPFFHTLPFGHYLGAWLALEDVDPEAGPLEFYAGGHRVAVPDWSSWAAEIAPGKAALDKSDYDALLEKFDTEGDARCREAGLEKTTADLKKGDRLIWHPWLPHGGRIASRQDLTRKSIAAHYIPFGTPVYNVDVFFGVTKDVPYDSVYNYEYVGDQAYVRQVNEGFIATTYLFK